MRKVPFLVTKCDNCGKEIKLWKESDFFAKKSKKKGEFDFFYICPECGNVEKQPECWLPSYLKYELIKKLVARESLFEGLAIFVAIVAAIGWWFLFR